MSSETTNAGPPQPGIATKSPKAPQPQVQQDRTATAQELVAFVTLFLAAGGASRDWAVVRKCPLCGYSHRHVVFEVGASVIERSPSCARHRTYRLIVSDIVPSAASRRLRGAA